MKVKKVYKRGKADIAADGLASLPLGSVPQLEQAFLEQQQQQKKKRSTRRRSLAAKQSESDELLTNGNNNNNGMSSSSHRRSLTSVGALSIRTELDTNPPVAIAGLILDKHIETHDLKRLVFEKLLNNQEQFYRLSSRIDDELNFFVSVDVDLNNHISRRKLECDGGVEREDDALRDLISHYMSKPFSIAKPMWEIILVDGYSKGQVLLFRVHHVIGDGTSISLICQTLCDGFTTEKLLNQLRREREEASEKEQAHWTGRLKQTPVLKQLIQFLYIVLLVLGCIRILFKWFVEMLLSGEPATFLNRYGNAQKMVPKSKSGNRNKMKNDANNNNHNNSDTTSSGSEESDEEMLPVIAGGHKRVAYSSGSMTVTDAKSIAKPFGATVNDVMLCCLAGAIDRYAQQNIAATESDDAPPLERCNVRVGIPVNIRTKVEEFASPSNKFGFMICKLPLGMGNVEQRLQWIRRETSWNKKLPESFFSNFVNFVIGKVTPVWLLKEFFKTMSQYQSLIVSNVVSNSEPCAINGSTIKSILPFTPLPWGIGLGLMILSYNNLINIALTTDGNLIPDPENLIDYIVDEFNALKAKYVTEESAVDRAEEGEKSEGRQQQASTVRQRTITTSA